MSTIMKILADCLFAFNLIFVLAGITRERFAKGTRGRYIFTTVQWAALLPALGFSAVSIVGTVLNGDIPIGSVLNFAVTVWVFYDLYKDDDNNWFKRKRKQLKQYLSSLRLRTPQLAGSRA